MSEAVLDENRVRELNEIQQELTTKTNEINSISARLADCLQGKVAPNLESSWLKNCLQDWIVLLSGKRDLIYLYT